MGHVMLGKGYCSSLSMAQISVFHNPSLRVHLGNWGMLETVVD